MPGGLQIEQDLALQRKEWRIQRVLWWVLVLVLLLAMLGLFGNSGPLNQAVAGDGTLKVEYQRFGRYQTAGRFQVTAGGGSRALQLMLDGDYWESVRIDRVTPEPASVQGGGRALTYTFHPAVTGPARITLHVTPQHAWRHRGRVGLPGGPWVEFTQIVYP